jgi:peptidoglycan/xylan/chitin deacetylase (PgdA/CDA1 family)
MDETTARKYACGLMQMFHIDTLARSACARHKVTTLVYHDPDPETLGRHLERLARDYSFITMDQAAAVLSGGACENLPLYPLVLTFDDGHAGNARLIDVLREFKVRPTIYLCSRVVGTARPFWWTAPTAVISGPEALKLLPDEDRLAALGSELDEAPFCGTRQALSWDEVRALAEVADIGAHSMTHPILTRCGDLKSIREIVQSRLDIEEALGSVCRHFAYPNGNYGMREMAAVKAAGYVTARTTDAGWNGRGTNPFRMRSFMVGDTAADEWMLAQTTGIPFVARKATVGLQRIVERCRTAMRPAPAGLGA